MDRNSGTRGTGLQRPASQRPQLGGYAWSGHRASVQSDTGTARWVIKHSDKEERARSFARGARGSRFRPCAHPTPRTPHHDPAHTHRPRTLRLSEASSGSSVLNVLGPSVYVAMATIVLRAGAVTSQRPRRLSASGWGAGRLPVPPLELRGRCQDSAGPASSEQFPFSVILIPLSCSFSFIP